MRKDPFQITTHLVFRKVKKNERKQVKTWLDQGHIKEWLGVEGIADMLKDLDQSFIGKSRFDHWVACDKKVPFAYFFTSFVDLTSTQDFYAQFCRTKGKALTLDILIFNLDYLGKGLATALIQEFLTDEFPQITEILIDPQVSNKKAIHVYKKAGFHVVKKFTPKWNPVPHYLMRATMQDMLLEREKRHKSYHSKPKRGLSKPVR